MSSEHDITFSSLDPSQKNTFRSIVQGDSNLHIVYGPPGTGKSQLVVSLLQRLAADNKKVLFVSQNIEALKVIERMIRRTETTIGYPTDSKFLSLLDFSLMLHNPTHRYLKYLREQYTKIGSKQLPQVSEVASPDDVSYILKYINLDHDTNYHVLGDGIGFDELVGYYIRYVHHMMAPESIRDFETVAVRAVFDALDNYKHKEYFEVFNQPRRELILLSTKNDDINLPDVRKNISRLKEVMSGEWSHSFATREVIDIADYLALLKHYTKAVKMLDIYKIVVEGKKLDELALSIREFAAAYETYDQKVARINKHLVAKEQSINVLAAGVDYRSVSIELNTNTTRLVDQDFAAVRTDFDRIVELIRDILEFCPDIRHASINDLWVGLAGEVRAIFEECVDDSSGMVGALTAERIIELRSDLEAYYSQNSVKRMLGGVPKSFKEYLNFTSPKDLEVYRDDFSGVLGVMESILAIKGGTVADVLRVSDRKAQVPLNRLGVKRTVDMYGLVAQFLLVHELMASLETYGYKVKDFEDMQAWATGVYTSLKALHESQKLPENKKILLRGGFENLIDAINKTIDLSTAQQEKKHVLEQQKDLLERSFKENRQFLRCVGEARDYATMASEIANYISGNQANIQRLSTRIDLPDDNRVIDGDLDVVQKTVDDVNLSDLFSDYFFEMRNGQTAADWMSSVAVLETYNNDAEIADFIEHNQSVNKIRVAVGSQNQKYLASILEIEGMTFDKFAARIVNVIVNESFGRARMSDKKHITTKDIVLAYEKYLKNQKVRMYCDDLRSMYTNALTSMKELSKQSTLQQGGTSNMDRYRHNTALISDAFSIVCATPKEVSKYIAPSKGLFDYVIFDEASQLLPGQALPSIYRAKNAVIIGDPHQMPPAINASSGAVDQAEDEFEDLGESILDLVRKQPQKQHHLKVHYRSQYNKLFEPSREAIYGDDGIEPIFEAQLAAGAPIDIIDDLGDEVDEYGYDKNFHKICESLNEYLDQDINADFCVLFARMDVLTKFKSFLAEVGERKYERIARLYDNDKILVSTVTNCQGIEGAYTVIYLHHYGAPGSMWFFKEAVGAYKRLNVSITRQRKGLKLLLADQKSQWLKTCDDKIESKTTGPNARKSAELMKALLGNAGEVSDTTYLDRKLGHNAHWFDSPLTEQLYEKLAAYYEDQLGKTVKIYSEVGWNLLIPTGEGIDANERNVGFRIDLGIYSIQEKRFILGIEMDGAMYHSGFDKEQSDYNRQRVLEEKGWELYRIWSTNWLNDIDKEFTRLTATIDNKLAGVSQAAGTPV